MKKSMVALGIANSSPPAWSVPAAVEAHASAGAAINILFVHIPFASSVEESEGPASHATLMASIGRALARVLEATGCTFGLQRWPADDFVAWIADTPDRPAPRIDSALELRISTQLAKAIAATPGAPEIARNRASEITVAREQMPFVEGPSQVNAYARALLAAQRGACDPVARDLLESAHLIDRALAARAFHFFHQPIVDCRSGTVLAHEALCRGTLDEFRFPDVIFGVAERTKRVWELGRVLRELVAEELDARESSGRDSMVFINVHPLDIDDPVFLEQALSGALARHADRIVVELTERAAIGDYRRVKAFFATLRRRGYRLAIDDLGSGYAGLTALAVLEPDFIKFDMGLVRDLHLHPVKQRLIRRMHEFAGEIGAQTISEGVENELERDALLSAGCSMMQGYFFARPAPGYPDVDPDRFPAQSTERSIAQ